MKINDTVLILKEFMTVQEKYTVDLYLWIVREKAQKMFRGRERLVTLNNYG